MREILFRGKGYSGEWFCGNLRISNLLNDPTDYVEILPINVGPPDFPTYERVQPETVGQYTGMLDKNGKKIFEGDLIFQKFEDGESEVAEVIWHDSPESVGWYIHSICPIPDFYPFCSFDCAAWEVIGNIHDNPEMLRKEKSE